MTTELENMAVELDKNGFSGKDITRAGYIYGMLEATLKGDDEAFNHFVAKLAKQYDMTWKANAN
jgi:hypothetical protein